MRDLAEAIVVGFALGAGLFINRMAQAVEVAEEPREAYRPDEGAEGADPAAVVYRIRGACSSRRSAWRSTGSMTGTGCWSSTSPR